MSRSDRPRSWSARTEAPRARMCATFSSRPFPGLSKGRPCPGYRRDRPREARRSSESTASAMCTSGPAHGEEPCSTRSPVNPLLLSSSIKERCGGTWPGVSSARSTATPASTVSGQVEGTQGRGTPATLRERAEGAPDTRDIPARPGVRTPPHRSIPGRACSTPYGRDEDA